MIKLVVNNLAKVVVVAVALTMVGVGVFSMSAMDHGGRGGECAAVLDHQPDCSVPVQAETCVSFHFGLLEKFSHGFTDNFALKFLLTAIALSVLYFVTSNLVRILFKQAGQARVRWRQFAEQTLGIFYETLVFWLSIFEKRDPSYAFTAA